MKNASQPHHPSCPGFRSILELGAGDLSFALSFARAQSGFERSADLTVTTLEHWQVVQTRGPVKTRVARQGLIAALPVGGTFSLLAMSFAYINGDPLVELDIQ